MLSRVTRLFAATEARVPGWPALLLAAGLAGCGQPSATDTPGTPATGPAPVAADSLRPATPPPAPDATATDTAAARPVLPAKPLTRARLLRPVAAVAAVATTPAEPAASEAAPAPAPEPAAPAAPATRTQAGRVLNEDGHPLAGATIMLRGTTKVVTTDASGNFSLEVPTGENTLSIGYGGYQDETATTRDGQPLNVTLLPTPKRKGRRE